jgi:uncharacterized protein (TIGR02452 family)
MNRRAIAEDTVKILERGFYTSTTGAEIHIEAPLKQCIDSTQCYNPDQLAEIRDQVLSQPAPYPQTEFELANETTLQGCARLVASGYKKIIALNFASAKNPGGGFLGGAQAQEESLARSSGLYFSLRKCQSYYDFHRRQHTTLYSDRMIFSPGCPVFRTDGGMLLEELYLVDFLTSAAPNAGAIAKNEPHNLTKIPETIRERATKLLGLAAHHGCDALVLGAWGCGAFRNDPVMVAEMFKKLFQGEFKARFPKVLFSVLDTRHGQMIYTAFADRFGAR